MSTASEAASASSRRGWLPFRVAIVSEILDGKVIALSEHEGAQTALVRFTGIDWDTQARIEAFAHRDREMT